MSKWVKKPVQVDAFQWTGGPDQKEDPRWIQDAIRNRVVWFQPTGMVIRTLEGNRLASPGDYIIRGIRGELYPCKADIFEATYEKTANEILLDKLEEADNKKAIKE